MLRLAIPREPYWVELARGVRVKMAPVTTAIMTAAQAAAHKALAEWKEEFGAADGELARGVAFALLVKALARMAIQEWEGVGGQDGNALEPTPEAVETLMELDDMALAFWTHATRPLDQVVAEGNG